MIGMEWTKRMFRAIELEHVHRLNDVPDRAGVVTVGKKPRRAQDHERRYC